MCATQMLTQAGSTEIDELLVCNVCASDSNPTQSMLRNVDLGEYASKQQSECHPAKLAPEHGWHNTPTKAA
jgi:hypothetical protein